MTPLTGIAAAVLLAVDSVWIAAASTNDFPQIPGWGQLGLAGLIIAAFYTDRVVTGRKYDQAIRERDAERERTEKAETFVKEKVADMVTESSVALRTVDSELLPLMRELREFLDHHKENHP